MKNGIDDLAVLGGAKLFATPRSTSSLVPPDPARVKAYLAPLFDAADGEGAIVANLERRFALFHDAADCIAMANGFWSLVLAIKALALPGRSEIVMPSLTYRRLADVAAWAGLKPRFCDVDQSTLAVSPATMEPCLGPDAALIMAVHPIVGVCDAAGLAALAHHRQLPILFDAVESVYETLPQGRVGRFGNGEVFSFHASKLLNGFEGGYVTTSDADLARRLRSARDHGRSTTGATTGAMTTNARLSALHAATALAALDGLSEQIVHNRDIYNAWCRHLADIPGIRVVPFDTTWRTSFKNILVELDPATWPLTRDMTVRILNAEGALARAYYAPPLHRKPMAYSHVPADLPLTDALASRFLLMPCGHFVSVEDVAMLGHLMRLLARGGSALRERLSAAGCTA
ncbi:MAG: hypothetical protein B7Z80_27130 [Rhodospirillales bacterium 20-64-7]|nr:MAG: hypothetical protein B7Z80_27130 [Rhodospirillales bacterium 20-64-7]HQT76556.1 DegT/DnrJ/EryC1/StrS family aminotransferase [Rhodopila sp.]